MLSGYEVVVENGMSSVCKLSLEPFDGGQCTER